MKNSIPASNLPRVVIIGGGFGGLHVTKALKNAPVQAILIDRNNYHTFQPLLYQVATAGLEPDSIGYPIRKIFKSQRNFLFRMADVLSVNFQNQRVETSIGPVDYDFLVLATGSRTAYFGMKSFQEHSMPMKSIPEAMEIRSSLLKNLEKAILVDDRQQQDALMTVVVVGGGPTGVETAGAIAELRKHILPKDYPELDFRRMQIHLVEAGPRLLAAMSETASQKARIFLEEMGVTIWLGTPVTGYDGRILDLKSGTQLKTGAVIWSAGVEGASIMGMPQEVLQRGNRVQINDNCQVVGFDNVYCIGDLAFLETKDFPKGLPGVAQVAMQMGDYVGNHLINRLSNKPNSPFLYKDLGSMATVGRNHAVADLQSVRFAGLIAWFLWLVVHLMSLVGFRNRVVVLINWIWNYFSYDRGIRLILSPTKTDK